MPALGFNEANVIRDIDKIIHCPYYNRYADKTQVLSFYKNDDISHRSLHVQLVSRIAKTIEKALSLNLDLIEAVALGHDIGHTPFGHAGESFLSEIYNLHTGRYFSHNIHSVRVLAGQIFAVADGRHRYTKRIPQIVKFYIPSAPFRHR